jgi:nitroreductase
MSVLDIIKKRQSVRKYLDKPVEDDKLEMILEAARLAPSSSNSQPWHFIAVKDKGLKTKLMHAVPLGVVAINKFIDEAPVVIVGCVTPGFFQKVSSLFGRENHIVDISIAMEHMVLAAEELGLGTCWIGWFDEGKVKKLLNVPRAAKVVAMITLGYPAEGGGHATTRKALDEIYSVDKY